MLANGQPFPIIRLYGPVEPWIDASWKPDDLTAS